MNEVISLILALPCSKVRILKLVRSIMTTATITSKGQVTIPAPVRIALGLESGSRIEFVEIETGKFAIIPATNSIKDLKGMLRKPDSPVSINDMSLAIAKQGAKAR